MFRLRLSRDQLALVSAITKSVALKRSMIEATTVFPAGTAVRVGSRVVSLESVIGSGLVGVVYAATCLDTGQRLAAKLARGPFSFFREAFRLEAATHSVLHSLRAVRPAEIVETSPLALLKEFCGEETLQQLILQNNVASTQRTLLVEALGEAAGVATEHGFIVDLSPKNLCWRDGWILMDTGPKIHATDFANVLDNPSWDTYCRYFEHKLQAAAALSAPSVLSAAQHDGSATPPATRYGFVRDWWRWFPYDPVPDEDFFFVEIDDGHRDEGVLFTIDLQQQPMMRVAEHADRRLARDPIVRQCALAAWRRDHPDVPASLDFAAAAEDWDHWKSTEPVTLGALRHEVEPLGIGKALKTAISNGQVLHVPTITVRPYSHWTDLLKQPEAFQPTDILCHELFDVPPNVTEAFLDQRRYFKTGPSLTRRDGPFCELTCVPTGDCRRAILFVAGFRAPLEAMTPLASALVERGVEGMLVFTYIGVRNGTAQPIVSGGRWETVLLWDAVDCVTSCLGADRVAIIGASHGAIGASVVAQLHPLVTSLVLDSPIQNPVNLVVHLGEAMGFSADETRTCLRQHHLPQQYRVGVPQRDHLRVLTLRPTADRFLDLCGELEGEVDVYYEGRHAATMRHDTAVRGVPPECLTAIHEFLEQS